MFSKEVIEGLMWNFHERFDSLSKRDKDIKESTEELLTLIGSNVTNLKKFRTNIEDAMSAIISDSSCLGYYIGLNDGANMMNSLIQSNLPEKIMELRGELLE